MKICIKSLHGTKNIRITLGNISGLGRSSISRQITRTRERKLVDILFTFYE